MDACSYSSTGPPCLNARAAAEMLLVSLDLAQRSRAFDGIAGEVDEDGGGGWMGEVNYAKGGCCLYGEIIPAVVRR